MNTKLHIFLTAPLLLLLLFFQGGCSSSESQEGVKTLLCWLRPSCLPPDGTTSPLPPPSPKPTSAPSLPPRPPAVTASPQKERATSRASMVCRTSAEATFTSAKPFVTISYREPTTKANGQPLTNLAKTTIYHDLGKGPVKYKEIPASGPQGGGTIKERITLSLKDGETIKATICVTATDSQGLEG